MWLGLAEKARTRPLPPEQQLEHLPTLEETVEQRTLLAEFREEALAAGVEGIPPKRFPTRQTAAMSSVARWRRLDLGKSSSTQWPAKRPDSRVNRRAGYPSVPRGREKRGRQGRPGSSRFAMPPGMPARTHAAGTIGA